MTFDTADQFFVACAVTLSIVLTVTLIGLAIKFNIWYWTAF